MTRASGVFTVADFTPQPFDPAVTTGLPVGYALMRKDFGGAVQGWSQTQFVYAYDGGLGTGTYVAMEHFSGSIDGREGSVVIAHTATTEAGSGRSAEMLVVVPGSGTGQLTGLRGTGSIVVDDDGTHHLHLDYTLDSPT